MKNLFFLFAFLLLSGIAFAQPCGMSLIVLSTSSGSCGQCDGSITVSATGGTPPYLYTWSNSQTDSVAVDLCAGSYTCTVIDADSCVSFGTMNLLQTAAVTVSVTITQQPSCPTCCDGIATSAVTSGTGPFTYAWSSGATTTSDSGLCEGKYLLCVTDANGCTGCDTIDLAADSAWGIRETLPENFVRVFPNPARDELQLQFENGTNEKAVAEIYTITGTLCSRHALITANMQRIDVSALAPGVYFICVETGNGRIYKKIVLE